MLEIRNRACIVKVPYYDFMVYTCCQQVIIVRLFLTPINVKDVRRVSLLKLSKWLQIVLRSIKESYRFCVIVELWCHFPHSEYTVMPSSSEELSILTKLHNPYWIATHLHCMDMP